MAAHTLHPLLTQFARKLLICGGRSAATLAEALSSTALIGGLFFLIGSALPGSPPPSAPLPRQQVVSVEASKAWMQAVMLSCGGPQPSTWQPILGRTLRCETGHVVSIPTPSGAQGRSGAVSAVGVPRGMTVRLECYGSSAPTIAAQTTLHSNGRGQWLATVGVWSCPAAPPPAAISMVTHP